MSQNTKKNRIAFHGSGYNKKYLLFHPWELASDWLHETKWFIQRGLYGYADCDTWNLDYYLSNWLPHALKQLRKETYSYPVNSTITKWRKTLKTIEEGFKEAQKVSDFANTREEMKLDEKKFHEGGKLFIKHFFNLWD